MMKRDAEYLITQFRMTVDAVIYDKGTKDTELADLRSRLNKARATGDLGIHGSPVPTSFLLLVLGMIRVWLDAPSDEREALTSCTVGVVDAFDKWLEAKLVDPSIARAEAARALGGR